MTALKALDAFDRVFKELSRESAYAMGGTLSAAQVDQLKLCVASDTQTKSFSFPLDDDAAKTLYDLGSPSPHGRGGETVYDETYRAAREIKPPHIALSHELLYTTSIVPLLVDRLGLNAPLIKINKLNMYTEGGFFKVHKDTPLAENHIGSIVICLPSSFEGGQLVVKQQGEERAFDYAADATKGLVGWTFLYSDCEHEVLPVTKGTRVTLAYDVYLPSKESSLSTSPSISDTRASAMLKAIQAILLPENRVQTRFMVHGGLLGVALVHEYPVSVFLPAARSGAYVRDLPGRLKGIDRIMYEAILSIGMTFEFNAIYQGDDDYNEYYMDDEDEDDDPDDRVGEDEQTLFFRSPSFFMVQENEMGENGGSMEECGTIPTRGVKWLVAPSHFEVENQYVAYGNQAQVGYIYATPAIIIEVPTVSGERPALNLDQGKDRRRNWW